MKEFRLKCGQISGFISYCSKCEKCYPINAQQQDFAFINCPKCFEELKVSESTCPRSCKNEMFHCNTCGRCYEEKGDGEGNSCPECHHKFETFDEPEIGSYN